jgi:hypothetical protein
MANLAIYYDPESAGSAVCEACGSQSWITCTNCQDCDAEVCSECGIYDGEDLRCKSCVAARQAETGLDLYLVAESVNPIGGPTTRRVGAR